MDLDDFLTPEARAELTREFGELEIKANPFLSWRMVLGEALVELGFSVMWGDNNDLSVIRPETGKYTEIDEKRRAFLYLTDSKAKLTPVPIMHLEDLYQQGAPAEATAYYLKTVSLDPRFKLWKYEELED